MNTEYFIRLKRRLDESGRKICFHRPKEFTSVKDVVNYALTFPVPATYTLGRNGKKYNQDLGGFKRSLHDLYLICKTYLGEVDIFEVLNALKEMEVHAHFCCTLNKMMFTKATPRFYTDKRTLKKYGI